MNRVITLSVEDIYIKYTGEAFGATGSHKAVTLRITFGPAWEGLGKTVYFTDALGGNPVSVILGLDTLQDGAYEVAVPSEALKIAGDATMTIKGVETDGDSAVRVLTTAAGHFRVLDSELPDSAGNAGTITASDKEQLQAEITGLETIFTMNREAAEAAAEDARNSADAAASSVGAAQDIADTVQNSVDATKDSAAASKNSAESAAASAKEAQASKAAAALARDAILNLGAVAESLPTGEEASVEKLVDEDGTVTLKFGLPRGEKGEKGEKGEQGERGANGGGSFTVRGTTLVIQPGTGGEGSYDVYNGAYNVQSTVGGDDTVLETANKVLEQDVTVENVGESEVSNLSGGKTLIIGG